MKYNEYHNFKIQTLSLHSQQSSSGIV